MHPAGVSGRDHRATHHRATHRDPCVHPERDVPTSFSVADADTDPTCNHQSCHTGAGHSGSIRNGGRRDAYRRADRDASSLGDADPDTGRVVPEPWPCGAGPLRLGRDDRIRGVDLAPLPVIGAYGKPTAPTRPPLVAPTASLRRRRVRLL
jgi:hypothetical protein